MLAAIDRIAAYTTGLTFESFCADLKTVDAVIRNFEVMGEAARHVDEPTAAPELKKHLEALLKLLAATP
jgi:uncharacterized protein with HEPN domain